MAAGERWQLTVRLKAPHGGSNPFGFDYELWLWEQGLQATGYVRVGPKDPAPLRLVQTGQHPVEWARQKVRDRIFAQVADRQQAGLIAALVVGDQNAIDRADWDVFRDTGVAHLMSISGLHVTMFAWLAALVVGWLWRRSGTLCLWVPAPNAALVCGVLLAAAYAAFSGGGLPSQRTVLMLATVGVLRLSGKQWPWPLVWLLACAAVVVVDPWALLQAGFWLSFVAVGVLFATDSGAAQAHKKGFIGHISSVFSEQWVITLALTPLTLLLFGQVSIVGLAANALAIPWVTLVVTPLAMAGVLLPLLWELAALAVSALAWYLKILASLPFASVTVAQAPLWAGVAGVVGGLLLAMPWPWRFRFLGFPLVLPVLLWQAPRPVEGQFELMAADIGQGNSVVVRTANHALVYDAGPRFSRDSDAGHRVLVPLLRALDVSVDRLMISHRDSDHVGGALAVLSQQPQADLMSSVEDDNAIQAVRKVTRCVAGQHWRWDGIDFDVLHPSAQDYALPNKSNAMSCVLRISNGSHTALLAGDIEQAQELRLVAGEGARLRADVLLVPHHGSKTSSSAEFLDAVKPSFALVQSGYRNRYGHPAEPVLVRYAERKIAVVDSPHCGAATWQSAHPTLVKCQREEGMRYWNHRAP
jgi:competence protein ComEC